MKNIQPINYKNSKDNFFCKLNLFLISFICLVSVFPFSATYAMADSTEINEICQSILRGKYGKMPPNQLVNSFLLAEGSTLYEVNIAHVLRKKEVLPVVLKKIQECPPIEKRKITKLLRDVQWPEATSYLLNIVLSDEEHELSRIGALYAIGSIGKKSVGNDILPLLDKSSRGITEKRIIIATLARLKHKQSIPKIRQYISNENIFIRLYAIRALSELGEKVDESIILNLINNKDYVIRQEACNALASTEYPEAKRILDEILKNDSHESVKRTAKIALSRLNVSKMSNEEKAIYLEKMIHDSDKKIKRWAINTLANKCEEKGKAVLIKKASIKTVDGKQAIYELIMSSVKEDK